MRDWLTRLHVAMLRLGWAVREYWKRIAVGAFCGWLIASVVGAFALVAFESLRLITVDDSAVLGPMLVFMGMGVGALVAYVARPESVEQEAHEP